MAPSIAGSVTHRPVLACRSRPTRHLSLLPLLAVVLLSALPLLPGVHGARALGDGKEAKVADAGDQMMMHAAAARWSVTVREGGGGHGSGHAGAGHGHGGGTGGHGGHGRPEPAGHHPGRRSAAPGGGLLAGQPSMAASFAALLAAVGLLRL